MSHTDELARLAELHRNGDLTDEEFAAAKKGLLETSVSVSAPEKVKNSPTFHEYVEANKKSLPVEQFKAPSSSSEQVKGASGPAITKVLVIGGFCLVVIALIAYFGRHESSNTSNIQTPHSGSKAPAASILASSYQIISENETAIGTLDQGDVGIELSRKLSDDEITTIAKQIHQDKSHYKSLHVTFWLKGMSKSAPSYATAIFEPDLKVERLGSTDEEQKQAALVATHNIDGRVIGAWHEDQYTRSTFVYFEKNGKSYERKIYESGLIDQDSSPSNILVLRYSSVDRKSSNIDTMEEQELIKRKVHGSMRFYEKDGRPDEYDVINKDGNLDFYDDEGYLTTGYKPGASEPTNYTASTPPSVVAHPPGIGKSRAFFIDNFPNVSFSKGVDIGGEENYVGTIGAAMVQLIGPADDLKEASITVTLDNSDREQGNNAGVIFGSFATIMVDGGAAWFANSIHRAEKHEVMNRFGNIIGKINVADLGNGVTIVTLTFSRH
jgi:hypothetical protein